MGTNGGGVKGGVHSRQDGYGVGLVRLRTEGFVTGGAVAGGEGGAVGVHHPPIELPKQPWCKRGRASGDGRAGGGQRRGAARLRGRQVA
eukprot:scaffold5440_cov88-Isochrysis_galbana.AAC.3